MRVSKSLFMALVPIFLTDIHAQPALTLPYCDNFNGTNLWQQVMVSGTPWQLGAPTASFPYTIYSPPFCWIVGINGPYVNNSTSYLYSPKFSFSGVPYAKLSFQYQSRTQLPNDGVELEYSTDSVTWLRLGGLNDPMGTGWYNDTLLCGNTVGWSGNSLNHTGQVNSWVKAQYILSPANAGNNATVWFRFVFCSDTAYNQFGFAVDDFCIIPITPVDAHLIAIIGPGDSIFPGGCVYFGTVLNNGGGQSITQANISYSINGGIPVSQTWNGLIFPGWTDTISFPCMVLPAGSYNLCIQISVAGDTIPSNDTLCTTFIIPLVIPITYNMPYCNNFENGSGYWMRSTLAGGQPGTQWQLGMPTFGGTTGTASGSNCWDINLTTGYQSNAHEALYSPYFDFALTGLPALSFAMNINSEASWDGMRMDYTIDSGLTWQVLGTANAPPSVATNWYTHAGLNSSQKPGWSGSSPLGYKVCTYHNLSFLNGKVARFRFVFTSDHSVNMDGVSVDDFCLYDVAPNNVQPLSVAISYPIGIYTPGQCYPFAAQFKNLGSVALTSLTAEIRVDGISVFTAPVTFNSPIPYGGISNSVLLSGCWTATTGTHNICLITSYPNGQPDLIPNNDTLCYTITVMDLEDLTGGAPFCNDFESTPKFLSLNALSYMQGASWQHGTPSTTFINGAYSGNKAWVTSLNQNYPANDYSMLVTPFFRLNTNISYRISFQTKFKIEYPYDGGTIQFSADHFNSWYHFGNPYYPQWMNTANVYALGPTPPPNIPGWSGLSTGWQQMEKIICFPDTAGNATVDVVFRFLFASDIFTQDEGWAIDDFCLVPDPAACVIGVPEAQGELPDVSVTPNPFCSQTTITVNAGHTGNLKLIITDLTGKVILSHADQTPSTRAWTYKIPRGNLDQGIYFYILQLNQHSVSGKLMVIGEE